MIMPRGLRRVVMIERFSVVRDSFIIRAMALEDPPGGPPSEPPIPPLSAAEKFAAKRANELTRLTATLLNNLAVGTIIAGVLSPIVSGRSEPWLATIELFAAAAVLHVLSRLTLRFSIKREE